MTTFLLNFGPGLIFVFKQPSHFQSHAPTFFLIFFWWCQLLPILKTKKLIKPPFWVHPPHSSKQQETHWYILHCSGIIQALKILWVNWFPFSATWFLRAFDLNWGGVLQSVCPIFGFLIADQQRQLYRLLSVLITQHSANNEVNITFVVMQEKKREEKMAKKAGSRTSHYPAPILKESTWPILNEMRQTDYTASYSNHLLKLLSPITDLSCCLWCISPHFESNGIAQT